MRGRRHGRLTILYLRYFFGYSLLGQFFREQRAAAATAAGMTAAGAGQFTGIQINNIHLLFFLMENRAC